MTTFDLDEMIDSLAPYQKAILSAPERYTVTIASTKAGKTYSHLVWLFYEFVTSEVYGNFWWVAPIYSQAKIAYKRLRRALAAYSIFKFNESYMSITFDGKVMQFKSADNPDGLYGDDVLRLVFDEFTRADESAWYACRSTLTKTQGRAKLIGNYTGDSNWGVRLQKEMEGNPAWKFFKITAYDAVDAGILSAEEVEQARKDLAGAPGMFDALYLAKGGYEPDRLIQSAAISDIFTNEFVPHGERRMTADIALMGSDLFVICVWSGWRLLKCYTIAKSEGNEVVEAIRDAARIWNVPESKIVYDRDGIGSYLRGYFPNATPFNGNKPARPARVFANRKAAISYKLAEIVNTYKMYIEPDALDSDTKTKLIKELNSLKSAGKDKEGALKVMKKEDEKKFLGHSPDIRDALALNAWHDMGAHLL